MKTNIKIREARQSITILESALHYKGYPNDLQDLLLHFDLGIVLNRRKSNTIEIMYGTKVVLVKSVQICAF